MTEFYQDLFPALHRGLAMSMALIVPSATLGLALGIVVGTIRTFGNRFLKRIGDFYAALFRGTPLVVQLMVLYFGLPNVGIYLDAYTAAVLGFVMCSAAYHSEYIRGGLKSIKQGQLRAARALGFSTTQALASIVVPQAVRRALPGCGNEIVYLIKYSSLAYIITCVELTGEAKGVAAKYFRFTESFFVAGCYYLALVTLATFILNKVEKKIHIPGFGKQA